jgi:hypothetical protein
MAGPSKQSTPETMDYFEKLRNLTNKLDKEFEPVTVNYKGFRLETGRKFVRVVLNGGAYFFMEIATGNIYKAASFKAPAKGVRFHIDNLLSNPEICDQYGSFLYRR